VFESIIPCKNNCHEDFVSLRGALLDASHPGVISRGAQGGGAPLVKISAHAGGAQPPLKLLHWLGFSEFIGLASKVL